MNDLKNIVLAQYHKYKKKYEYKDLPEIIDVNILKNSNDKKMCLFNSMELYSGIFILNISKGYIVEANENEFQSVLIHEFTHLSDAIFFRGITKTKKDFDGIMQSYSEINANYEKMKYLFRRYRHVNLSPDLDTVIRDGKQLYSLGYLINGMYNNVKDMFEKFDDTHNPEILIVRLRKLFYAIGIEKYIYKHCKINFNQNYEIFPSHYREYCEEFRRLAYSEDETAAIELGVVFWKLIEYFDKIVQDNKIPTE